MSKKSIFTFFLVFSLAIIVFLLVLISQSNIAMLEPKGSVAADELHLMATATLLMLIVVIPVFVLTIFISWKYRAGNKTAKYTPDRDHSTLAETVWWGFPCIIILILSIVTWKSTHALDPYKPLDSKAKPITIQVVALQWKWLFIYPEQNIATINFFQFPEQVPINFEITADAPMNSFWIPQLGGQIYAMPGMKTKLHLIASEPGSFNGSSANLSGEGFAGMTFIAKSSSQGDFDKWVESAKQSPSSLTLNKYQELVKPTSYDPVSTYVLKEENLFEAIVMKPMMPMTLMLKDKK